MKDLKHLFFFENLLQESYNESVAKAVQSGKRAVGYTCYYIPEVLLNLQGCFGVRLRAPRSTSPDMATYYLTNRNCPFSRAFLERAIEGGYNFLNAFIGSETCAAMDRAQEHISLLHLINTPNFFIRHLDAPFKDDERSVEHYERQLQIKLLDPLSKTFGIKTDDKAIMNAVERHNELCRVITAIGELRKKDPPVISGYEFAVIQLVSLVCPHEDVIDKLKETLEELKKRVPDEKSPYRVRVVVAGSEIDNPDFIKLIEDCGALVVADRYCYGSFPGREEIVVREGEKPLTAVARHYLQTSQCPRFMNSEKVEARPAYIKNLFTEFNADGVIIESMKFCEFWGYEKALASHILINEMDVPCCTIEKEYVIGSAGQLRTRFQAFVESLEIKKLNAAV